MLSREALARLTGVAGLWKQCPALHCDYVGPAASVLKHSKKCTAGQSPTPPPTNGRVPSDRDPGLLRGWNPWRISYLTRLTPQSKI